MPYLHQRFDQAGTRRESDLGSAAVRGWCNTESYKEVIAELPKRDAAADRQGHKTDSCLINCNKIGTKNPYHRAHSLMGVGVISDPRFPACPVSTTKGLFRTSGKKNKPERVPKMRGELLFLTFPVGGVSLDVSLLGLSSQVSVAMDIAVGCRLSSAGGRSAFLRSHRPSEGDLAAVSALQLQEKKRTLMNITYSSSAVPDTDDTE